MNKKAKVVPIVDCTNEKCGAKDVPASYMGCWTKEVSKGIKKVYIWVCPDCNTVLNLASALKVKKWLSIEELEKMGWKHSRKNYPTNISTDKIEIDKSKK